VPGHRAARVLHLVRAPWVRARETCGRGRLRHHAESARRCGEPGSPGSAAAVFAQCLLQICLKRGESLALSRRQV
jgi:hypothetical protein